MAKIFIILLFIFFGSCKDPQESHILTVETTQVSFSAEQSVKLINCSSDADIVVVSSQPAWCAATVNQFENEGIIKIRVTKNTSTNEARTAVVSVNAGNAVQQFPSQAMRALNFLHFYFPWQPPADCIRSTPFILQRHTHTDGIYATKRPI